MLKLFIKRDANPDFLIETLTQSGVKNLEIIKNAYGKPYLKSRELFFNKSHSRDLTAVAVSDRDIGVDIQTPTFREPVLRRAFTPAEQQLVRISPDPTRAFTRLWTMKEAYVKMLGIGLSYGLRRVDTLKLAPKFVIIDTNDYCLAIIESHSS